MESARGVRAAGESMVLLLQNSKLKATGGLTQTV